MLRVDFRDLIGGGLIALAGAGAMYHSLTAFELGTLARMGPGYFPALVSGLLILCGLSIGIPALLRAGPMPVNALVEFDCVMTSDEAIDEPECRGVGEELRNDRETCIRREVFQRSRLVHRKSGGDHETQQAEEDQRDEGDDGDLNDIPSGPHREGIIDVANDWGDFRGGRRQRGVVFRHGKILVRQRQNGKSENGKT